MCVVVHTSMLNYVTMFQGELVGGMVIMESGHAATDVTADVSDTDSQVMATNTLLLPQPMLYADPSPTQFPAQFQQYQAQPTQYSQFTQISNEVITNQFQTQVITEQFPQVTTNSVISNQFQPHVIEQFQNNNPDVPVNNIQYSMQPEVQATTVSQYQTQISSDMNQVVTSQYSVASGQYVQVQYTSAVQSDENQFQGEIGSNCYQSQLPVYQITEDTSRKSSTDSYQRLSSVEMLQAQYQTYPDQTATTNMSELYQPMFDANSNEYPRPEVIDCPLVVSSEDAVPTVVNTVDIVTAVSENFIQTNEGTVLSNHTENQTLTSSTETDSIDAKPQDQDYMQVCFRVAVIQ